MQKIKCPYIITTYKGQNQRGEMMLTIHPYTPRYDSLDSALATLHHNRSFPFILLKQTGEKRFHPIACTITRP